MTKSIYEEKTVFLIDGTPIVISPLKLAYLKPFMEVFDNIKTSKTEDETVDVIAECIVIAMKQFYPQIKTPEEVLDNIDMKTLYAILKYSASIDLNPDKVADVPEQAKADAQTPKEAQDNQSWEAFDLAKYESQVFLLGVWKNYSELEHAMSLPEIVETLSAANEKDYNDRKFLAAIQGVDLEGGNKEPEEDPWEAMKARVAAKTSGIDPQHANDIVSYSGIKARQTGFGIGMGLDYEKID